MQPQIIAVFMRDGNEAPTPETIEIDADGNPTEAPTDPQAPTEAPQARKRQGRKHQGRPALPVDTSPRIWECLGDAFKPATTTMQVKQLPGGLSQFGMSQSGWLLVHVGDRYEFPYKLYGSVNAKILDRVTRAWGQLDSNLGVLLNGEKGTGKTITAQQIANYGVDNGIPVLVVREPIPLTDVLSAIRQDVIVLFDEFEKTHKKNDDQQALLTALDGMARSPYRRMFIFTTNEKHIDPNFIDRPSRVRYTYEFLRLSEAITEEIVDDMLDTDLVHMKPDILSYFASRKVLSVDIVKTVVREVNVFREAPEAFAAAINITEQDTRSFTLEVLDNTTDQNVVKTMSSYFMTAKQSLSTLRKLTTRSGVLSLATNIENGGLMFVDPGLNLWFTVTDTTDTPGVVIGNLRLPVHETWLSKHTAITDRIGRGVRWLDARPEGWKMPSWATKFIEKGAKAKLTKEEEVAMEEYSDRGTVYGTGTRLEMVLKITANVDYAGPKRYTDPASWAPTGGADED